MSLIHLETAVLVQQRANRYELRALLMPGIFVERRRYRDAEQAFKSALVKMYSEHYLDRENLDELLWYALSQGIELELLSLTFKSGLYYVDGIFAIAKYRVKERNYLCFPKLEYLTVLQPESLTRRGEWVLFVQETIQEFIRKKRQSCVEEPFDFKVYYSQPNDTFVTLPATIRVRRNRYHFEYEDRSPFSFITDQATFNGAEELQKVGEDWNNRYPDNLQTALFRESLQHRLEQALYGKYPTPVVLVAPTGTGKTNLLQSLVKGMIDQTPNRSAHRMVKLWLVDPLRVISGMSVVGQWERRWEVILEYLQNRLKRTVAIDRPDILYIDNPVALFHVGKSAQTNLTLAHLLRPYLESRKLSCLLEATPQQWQRIQELDRTIADLFQVIRIPTLNEAEQREVVIRERARLEMEHECQIKAKTLTTLIKLEPEFRADQSMPGSAISSLAQIARKYQKEVAEPVAVYELYHSNFHFRREIIDRNIPLNAKDVDAFFKKYLVGQEGAHAALCEVVLKIKARLAAPGKPLNSMLLIGPTGVGKTESAKLLTEYLFQRQECLVRIDLNEFGDAGAVSRLIGDTSNPNGILTERVRYQRACVLLLDEIEKAHPNVHDLLLQLLDDGRLTDALGRTTDFTQTVVIMTSNLGAQAAAKTMGFMESKDDMTASYRQAVEQFFRPEFLNRIEKQVSFRALSREHMKQLATLHLGKLIQRDGFIRRNTILNIERNAMDMLCEGGYDPQMGARALKRYLEQRITRMSAHVLANLTDNAPIILKLYMKEKELQCSVQALKFMAMQACEPQAAFSLEDYRFILKQLREMDQDILDIPDHEFRNFAWTLSAKIRDLIEPLQSFIWDFEERLSTSRMQVKMNFQHMPRRVLKESWRGLKVDAAALFAQFDMRDYLRSLYQQGEGGFDKEKLSQACLTAELQWLLMGSTGLIKQKAIQGCFVIRSLLPGQGANEIRYLADNYSRLITDIASIEQQEACADGVIIHYQGPGVDRLIEAEQGIHLFIGVNNSQIPIAVIAMKTADVIEQLTIPDTILRLYALPTSTTEQNDDTVTDLRSGMVSGSALSLEDLKIIVTKAMPPFPIKETPSSREED
ncbi:MAG: AAA family ATPase [Candidatus Thiodiazotropha sp.]